jgi:exonuclease VII large subunit
VLSGSRLRFQYGARKILSLSPAALRVASLPAAAAEIGVASLMMNLRTVNNRLDDLYRERMAAEAAQTAASASSLKQPVVKSYEHFCDLVQQAANLLPGDVITALFNEMDVMRKKYAALPHKTDPKKPNTDSNR